MLNAIAIVLALTAAEPAEPPLAILALKGGSTMTVQSYEIDGRRVRIVGSDGQDLVIKTDLVDVERSEQMTLAAQQRVANERAAAELRAREREAARKRHIASTKKKGSFTIAPVLSGEPSPGDPRSDAVDEPGSERKPELLFFTASWCGWCRKLDAAMATASVGKELAGFRLSKVDIDAQPALASKYGVRSVPTLVRLTADGKTHKVQRGYLDAAALASWLR